MAILKNRVNSRNHLLASGLFFLTYIRKLPAVLLILIASYFLVIYPPRSLSAYFLEFSGRILSVGVPIYSELVVQVKAVNNKISYLRDIEAENTRLKLKLAELSYLEHLTHELALENAQLKQILNNVQDSRQYVTAKILAMNFSPFTNSAIIQGGSKNNIKIDDIVQTRDGLLGRIIQVSDHYANIMLTTDHNSRIPIITENTRERGIIARHGDNLKIIYLRENHNVTPGEVIITSGEGKIYPYGLKVAIIDRITEEGVFAKISTDLDNLDYVTVYTPDMQIFE